MEAGYVLRLRSLPAPRFGAAPHVFTLARRGRQYLEALGIVTPAYYRPCEEEEKARNHPFLVHTLATIDVLIAADLLCQAFPVACPVLRCERELRHRPVRVDVPPLPGASGNRRVAVIPDAWFQLWVHGEAAPCSISLELDRGSEDQAAWRGKVAALAAWAEGPYQQAFATDNLTIAVVTLSPARRDQLRDWTTRELSARGLARLSDIFLITSTDPVRAPPGALFFDALWYPPDAQQPVPLLDRPVSPATDPIRARQEAVILQL